MGTRYCAIFRHLGVPVIPVDTEPSGISWPAVDHAVQSARGLVIATPTPMHWQALSRYREYETPILCEKPVTKNPSELQKYLLGTFRHPGLCFGHTPRQRVGPFAMMMQYQILNPPAGTSGTQHVEPTEYDYFRSGQDGLGWDCISLLGLAREPVSLRNESPVWRCTLNGRVLSHADVEQAYVDFVARWLKEPEFQDRAWLVRAHEKAEAWRG